MKQYPVEDRELTLIIEGSRYALIGDSSGVVYRAPLAVLPSLRDYLAEAVRVPAPPKDSIRVGVYRAQVRLDIPDGVTLYFAYVTDTVSGIIVYVAFERARNKWYLRELRDNEDNPSGSYHREAGAEAGG